MICRPHIYTMILPQVQSAYALACIILAHPENQKLLEKETTFSYSLLIDLLYSADKEVRKVDDVTLTS